MSPVGTALFPTSPIQQLLESPGDDQRLDCSRIGEQSVEGVAVAGSLDFVGHQLDHLGHAAEPSQFPDRSGVVQQRQQQQSALVGILLRVGRLQQFVEQTPVDHDRQDLTAAEQRMDERAAGVLFGLAQDLAENGLQFFRICQVFDGAPRFQQGHQQLAARTGFEIQTAELQQLVQVAAVDQRIDGRGTAKDLAQHVAADFDVALLTSDLDQTVDAIRGHQMFDHPGVGQQLSQQLASLMLVALAQRHVVQFFKGAGAQQGFHRRFAGEQGAQQILPRLDVALCIDRAEQVGDSLAGHPMLDHRGMRQQAPEQQASPRCLRFLVDLCQQVVQSVMFQDHLQVLRALQQAVPDLVPGIDRDRRNRGKQVLQPTLGAVVRHHTRRCQHQTHQVGLLVFLGLLHDQGHGPVQMSLIDKGSDVRFVLADLLQEAPQVIAAQMMLGELQHVADAAVGSQTLKYQGTDVEDAQQRCSAVIVGLLARHAIQGLVMVPFHQQTHRLLVPEQPHQVLMAGFRVCLLAGEFDQRIQLVLLLQTAEDGAGAVEIAAQRSMSHGIPFFRQQLP